MAWLSPASGARPESGYALTFDDDYIDEWHSLLPVLARWNARATFFVTRAHRLDAARRIKLRELAAAGHEIGAHGHEHRGVVADYGGDPGRVAAYEREEVIAARRALSELGVDAASFAFPYGQHAPEYIAAVLRHFRKARLTGHKRRWVPIEAHGHLYQRPGAAQPVLSALGIDHVFGYPPRMISAMLRHARRRARVACLYAHKVADPDPTHTRMDDPEAYRISVARIEALCAEAHDLGLRAYTVGEL